MQKVKRGDQQHRRRDPDCDYPEHVPARGWRHGVLHLWGPGAEGRGLRRDHPIRRSRSKERALQVKHNLTTCASGPQDCEVTILGSRETERSMLLANPTRKSPSCGVSKLEPFASPENQSGPR